jgi:EmrB/QacA subfamily drug resistance transporter
MRDVSPTPDTLPGAPSAARRAFFGRWTPLPVLMTGTFLIVLDFFAVNVALPSMQRDLRASDSALEWVVAGYALTFAIFLIAAGRLGDRLGRRRVLMTGFCLFTLASGLCGLAPDAAVLVGARLLQGTGAALISPSVLSLVGVIYAGQDRARAVGVYALVMGLAGAGGQLIGGALVQADIAGLGWRTVFLMNLPIGLAALALARAWIPESQADHPRPLDFAGLAVFTLALAALILPLVQGQALGWPAWCWLSLVVGLVLLGAFGIYQAWLGRRDGAPLLDPALFRKRAFSAGLLTQVALWCGQASFFLVLALYLQGGRGLDPLQAGVVFTALAGAYLVASLRAPALTLRFGRGLVAGGALILGAGHGLLLAAVLAEGIGGPVVLLAPGLLLVGAGMGLCITALVTTVLSSADPQRAGAVSGALSTVQQLGNALGVAVSGAIFFGSLGSGYAQAFESTLAELACLMVAVALSSRLLPERRRAA